jgi:hypothetical protein
VSERRALKLHCGAVGQVALFAARGMPKLSLIWRKLLRPQQHVHIRQGSLSQHGWTISFNPKIVLVQSLNHMPAGNTRIEQVFAANGRDRPDFQSHRITTRLLCETIFADRLVTRKADDRKQIERVARSGRVQRQLVSSLLQNWRKPPSELAPNSPRRCGEPLAALAQPQKRTRRSASPLATILPEPHAKMPVAHFAMWPRQRTSQMAHLRPSGPKASRPADAVFQSMRTGQPRHVALVMRQLPAKPAPIVMQTNGVGRIATSVPVPHVKRRPTAEQVWLKSPENPSRLVEIAPGRQFTHPIKTQVPHFQIAATPMSTPHSTSQPPLPDMNRLVDEVLRRIDRVSRDERLRRGI